MILNSDEVTVMVTGGAGFIGSHTCIELLNSSYNVIVVDNLANSSAESIKRVKKITGKNLLFFEADLRDSGSMDKIFSEHKIDAVIHFAGYKAVGESVEKPLLYYSNNVSATITLLELMGTYEVNKIVFSSSCTVYGNPISVPVKETDQLSPTNPYGRSKWMVEQLLEDFWRSNSDLSVSILRYFNPIGAHFSGLIGEDPNGIPNNLLPYIAKVAAKKMDILNVFGGDYKTVDGTGVRDYVHVVDLAQAHLFALEEILVQKKSIELYNLGTGRGYSVLEVVEAFEKATGDKIPYRIIERRPGDVDATYADARKAESRLGWKAKKDLNEMCRDTWNWQVKNPDGYNEL